MDINTVDRLISPCTEHDIEQLVGTTIRVLKLREEALLLLEYRLLTLRDAIEREAEKLEDDGNNDR